MATSTSGSATASAGGPSSGNSATGGSDGGGPSGDAATGGSDGGGPSGSPIEAGPPTGDAAACSVGVQADPGTMGEGTTMINAPYVVPAEATALMNGAPAGTLTTPALYPSKTVYPGISFQYTILVPAQYQKGKPAALLIILDGHKFVAAPAGTGTIAWTDFGGWHADNVVANLIHAGQMPVTITVFIDPGTASGMFTDSAADNAVRSTQYDHADDKYSQFTFNEFLPDAVLPNYDIVQDPNGWGAVGHSSGGIAIFNMAMLHPEKLRKPLTMSASFPNQGVWPAKLLTLMPTPEPVRIHLLSSPNDSGGIYATNNQAAKDLATLGYHYQYIVGTSPHFPTPAGIQDFPNALRWMWRGYSLPCYP
jgi:enterochelin esterase family protein